MTELERFLAAVGAFVIGYIIIKVIFGIIFSWKP